MVGYGADGAEVTQRTAQRGRIYPVGRVLVPLAAFILGIVVPGGRAGPYENALHRDMRQARTDQVLALCHERYPLSKVGPFLGRECSGMRPDTEAGQQGIAFHEQVTAAMRQNFGEAGIDRLIPDDF